MRYLLDESLDPEDKLVGLDLEALLPKDDVQALIVEFQSTNQKKIADALAREVRQAIWNARFAKRKRG